MFRYSQIKTVFINLFFGAFLCFNTIGQDKKTNIVIIFVDDLGYADLGCYGARGFNTPNLDTMAEQGMRFTNFYVGASVCSPSRAALLTGKYSIATNMHKGVLFPFSKGGLKPNALTLAEVLKSSGYQTGCVGKWHLGHSSQELMPNNQGFEYFYGIPYSNDMDARKYPKQDYQAPELPIYRNKKIIDQGADQRFFTKRFTQESINFIKRNKEKPFFLYLAHPMPHTPVHVSPDFMHSSKYGRYGDTIQELDWSVGQILKTLKSLEIAKNTLVLFTSDNGPDQGFWMGTNHGKATPLRGSKGTTWEGGFRVPFLAYWPNKIKGGVLNKTLISAMDLFLTIAEITKSKLPKDYESDGRDISETLLDYNFKNQEETTFFYYGTHGEIEAVRSGKWKLHIAKRKGWNKDLGVFKTCLFNLEQDIGEHKDVSKNNLKKVQELQQLIRTKQITDL